VIASRWMGLGIVFVAGLGAMAALQTLHSDPPDARMIELTGREPARLGKVVDAEGRDVVLDSFRGKVLILNLWAPWCAPCLKEMPSLDRLAASLPADKFAVVAISQDPPGDSPSQRMLDKLGLSHVRTYLDPAGKLHDQVGARGFPATLIVGADGAPLAFREGAADWDSEAMRARIAALAARPAS
jgi:thiol-disulfide isomerase/thioredoxin